VILWRLGPKSPDRPARLSVCVLAGKESIRSS
jgi:hypothetical protein